MVANLCNCRPVENRSQEGRGAVYAQIGRANTVARNAEGQGSFRGRILVVDDHDLSRRAIVDWLCGEGHQCDSATNSDEAVATLRTTYFDLLVTEAALPGEGELQLAKEAQRIWGNMPVVVVAANPSLNSAIEAVRLPVVAYLIKPLAREALLSHAGVAIRQAPVRRTVSRVAEHLEHCQRDLAAAFSLDPPQSSSDTGEAASLTAAVRMLASCIDMLLSVPYLQGRLEACRNLCEFMQCEQWTAHQRVLRDVVDVLQETKRRFKSKELAELRERVSRHLENPRAQRGDLE